MDLRREHIEAIFKKFWHLLWKDNSIKGWLFSVVFLLVFIKFVFFPILTLLTGTALPLAIVESCSMYHEGNLLSNFNSWWQVHEEKYERFEITEDQFQEFKMSNGFNKGDILFITKARPDKLQLGDIIIFDAGQRNPIIHRIVQIREVNGEKIFSTIGDNNLGQLSFEENITEGQLIGKASIKAAPYLGWVKLVFYDWQKSESEKGFC